MIKFKNKYQVLVKRVVPLLLAALMVLSVVASALSSISRVYAADLRDGLEQNTLEKLKLVTGTIKASPGAEENESVTVLNTGDSTLEVTGFSSSAYDSNGNLVVTFDSDENVSIPAGKEAELTGRLSVASGAERKIYSSKDFTISFADTDKTITRSIKYSLGGVLVVPSGDGLNYTEIDGSIAQPRMDIAIASNTPSECREGQKINMTVLLSYNKNAVSKQIGMISVSSEAFTVVDGMVTRNLAGENSVYSGSEKYTRAVQYQLQAKDSIASGYYPVTIKVDYYDDEETAKYTSENTYNIYINGSRTGANGETVDAATPFLIVEQYDYGTDDVVAGDTFDLKMSIKNTGYLAVENILVAITAPDELAITSSSNTLYIDRLAAGASMEKVIQFRAKGSAIPGSHAINVKFSYQYLDNGSRRAGSTEENIAIPVIQQDRFFVNDLEPPTMMFTGEDNMIDVTFINKGTTDVRNISAEISGENLANPGQSQYIGNLQPGEENSASFTLQAMEAGTLKGEVLLTYEDSNGTQKEVTKEFSIEVQEYIMPSFEDMPMDPGMMEPMDEGFRMPFWGWLIIAAAGTGVVIAVIVVVVKKRKAKKAQEEADEDF